MGSSASDRGVTLVETLIAILVAFIAMASVGAVIFSAMVSSRDQGTETSRMTVLAQQKMEELLRLNSSDTSTNTTLVTDTGWKVGLTSNSSTDLNFLTSCPVAGSSDVGYIDFLDANGIALGGTCSSVVATTYGYERRWRITDVPGVTGLKQITVLVYSPNAVHTGKHGVAPPFVSLTSLKSQ